MYRAALLAKRNGCRYVATQLSALEEGTPEFYDKIGLAPTPERRAEVEKILPPDQPVHEREAARERMLWAGALRGEVDSVIARAKAAVDKYFTENPAL
jgi:hypothetical protein